MPTCSETHYFSERNFRGKKIGSYLHLCNDFVPSCASLNKKVKENKNCVIFSWRVLTLELRLLPTSLCFVSWCRRHIMQELGTHFQKREKTDGIDSPSKRRWYFKFQTYETHWREAALSFSPAECSSPCLSSAAPFQICLFSREQLSQKSVGAILILKLNLCLTTSLKSALCWWGVWKSSL